MSTVAMQQEISIHFSGGVRLNKIGDAMQILVNERR